MSGRRVFAERTAQCAAQRATRGIAMIAAMAMALGVVDHAAADGRACVWDADAFSFVGTPVEQARCLLRPVAIGGRVGDAHATLPPALDAMVGRPVAFDAATLRAWLRTQGIDESGVGGSLDAPLSFTEGPQPRRARYFVIHDTSHLLCQREDFPANADAADAPWNLPARWTNDPQAHLFITRDGAAHAPQGRSFATPWRATKLEKFLREPSRGLFLHIENVQLRRPEVAADAPLHRPGGECVNDRIAQRPGFSPAQNRRLALVYVAASVRAGEWLIPAYHAVLDTGFIGGHDDPQHFDIDAWTTEVCALRGALGDRCEAP